MHFELESSAHMEHLHILLEHQSLTRSALAFCIKIELSLEASSHFASESHFRVERACMLLRNRARAWRVFTFGIGSSSRMERPHILKDRNQALA